MEQHEKLLCSSSCQCSAKGLQSVSDAKLQHSRRQYGMIIP